MDTGSVIALVGGLSGWAAFGLLALRVSGIKRDRDKADLARQQQADELRNATVAFKVERKRTARRLEDLQRELEEMDQELAQCSVPGSVRRRLNRLLQTPSAQG